MNFKVLKSKKVLLIIISIILALIALGLFIYFYVINNLESVPTLATDIDETVLNELEDENNTIINIDDLPEIEEEIIEKNNENTEKNKNTTEKNESTSKSKNPYYIKVNYGAQVVTVYKQDENGEYTVPVKAMVCSTGTSTPKSGTYSIPSKYRWLQLKGNVFGQYCTRITGHILFHSVPYLRQGDPSSLEYWEYDKLGTAASAGCIRLTVADAMWIYNNCSKGTKVEFYSSSNPGPLGKPSANKISSSPDNLKNWDPTDPASNNPWKGYKEPTVNSSPDNKNNTIKDNTVTSGKDNTIGNTVTSGKDNTIKDNTVTSGKDNTIKDNTVTSGKDNTIKGNTVTSGKDNTIKDNTVTSGKDNTIKDNTVTSGKDNTIKDNTVTSGKDNTIKDNTVTSSKDNTITKSI